MAQNAWGWLRARTKEQRGWRNREVVLGHKLKSDSQTVSCKWPAFANKSIKPKSFSICFQPVTFPRGRRSHPGPGSSSALREQTHIYQIGKLEPQSIRLNVRAVRKSDSIEFPQRRLLTWEQADVSVDELESCASNLKLH